MWRYVILRHEMPAEAARTSHWDLMLEFDGVLRTWALGKLPCAGAVMDVEALPDHRMDYLEYEGPVSGGRGTVRHWDEGTFRLLRASDLEMVIELMGRRLHCVARLNQQTDSHLWRLTFTSD